MSKKNITALIETGPISGNYENWFGEIAEEMLLGWQIIANGMVYRFKEIEFYYHDKNHPDTTAYGYMPQHFKKDNGRIYRHKGRQTMPLTWFVHYSGIDIVFGKENAPGGLLIRAIERMDGEKVELIKGPLVVMLELLNQGVNVFDGKGIEMRIVEAEYLIKKEIVRKPRVGLGESGYKDAKYNFSVD